VFIRKACYQFDSRLFCFPNYVRADVRRFSESAARTGQNATLTSATSSCPALLLTGHTIASSRQRPAPCRHRPGCHSLSFFVTSPAWSKPHAPASDDTTKTLRIFGLTRVVTAWKSARKLLSYSPARLDPFHWRKAFCKRCETVRKLRGYSRLFPMLSSRQDGPWRGSNVKVSSRVAERTAKLSSVLRLRVNLGLSSPRRKKARSVAGLGCSSS